MLSNYVDQAVQLLHRQGGFSAVPAAELELPPTIESVLIKEEPGLVSLVGLGTSEAGLLALRAVLLEQLRLGPVGAGRADGMILLVLIVEEPLTPARYLRWAQEKVGGSVLTVPWVVDLLHSRLIPLQGPPFGLDPVLAESLTPDRGGWVGSERQPNGGRSEGTPQRVTTGLIGLMAVIWLTMSFTGGSLNATESPALLYAWGAAARPDLWLKEEYWRLFTANFLHIGYIHLGLNCLALWSVGRVVEALYGSGRLLFIFLMAGLAGATMSAVVGPPVVYSAGASGAIFGLLGAIIWYRLVAPQGNRIPWRPLLITLGLNLGLGIALYRIIDNWNHVGGLIGGIAASAVIGISGLDSIGQPGRESPVQKGRLLVAAGLVVVSLLMVTGRFEIPGPGRVFARSIIAVGEGRGAEGEAGLRATIRRQPDHPQPRLYLVIALLEQGKCADAGVELAAVSRIVSQYAGVTFLQEALNECQEGVPQAP